MNLLLEGDDLEALLIRAHQEGGASARIVSAQKIRRGGFLGFFAREGFEVAVEIPTDEVRVDERPAPSAQGRKVPRPRSKAQRELAGPAALEAADRAIAAVEGVRAAQAAAASARAEAAARKTAVPPARAERAAAAFGVTDRTSGGSGAPTQDLAVRPTSQVGVTADDEPTGAPAGPRTLLDLTERASAAERAAARAVAEHAAYEAAIRSAQEAEAAALAAERAAEQARARMLARSLAEASGARATAAAAAPAAVEPTAVESPAPRTREPEGPLPAVEFPYRSDATQPDPTPEPPHPAHPFAPIRFPRAEFPVSRLNADDSPADLLNVTDAPPLPPAGPLPGSGAESTLPVPHQAEHAEPIEIPGLAEPESEYDTTPYGSRYEHGGEDHDYAAEEYAPYDETYAYDHNYAETSTDEPYGQGYAQPHVDETYAEDAYQTHHAQPHTNETYGEDAYPEPYAETGTDHEGYTQPVVDETYIEDAHESHDAQAHTDETYGEDAYLEPYAETGTDHEGYTQPVVDESYTEGAYPETYAETGADQTYDQAYAAPLVDESYAEDAYQAQDAQPGADESYGEDAYEESHDETGADQTWAESYAETEYEEPYDDAYTEAGRDQTWVEAEHVEEAYIDEPVTTEQATDWAGLQFTMAPSARAADIIPSKPKKTRGARTLPEPRPAADDVPEPLPAEATYDEPPAYEPHAYREYAGEADHETDHRDFRADDQQALRPAPSPFPTAAPRIPAARDAQPEPASDDDPTNRSRLNAEAAWRLLRRWRPGRRRSADVDETPLPEGDSGHRIEVPGQRVSPWAPMIIDHDDQGSGFQAGWTAGPAAPSRPVDDGWSPFAEAATTGPVPAAAVPVDSADQLAADREALRALGVPAAWTRLLQPGDRFTSIVRMLGNLAEHQIDYDADVIAVVGPAHVVELEAHRTALDLPEHGRPRTVAVLPHGPEVDLEAAFARAQAIRPVVVAVPVDERERPSDIRHLLTGLRAGATVAVVDAAQPLEHITRWVENLEGVDALALDGALDSETPAAVLGLGVPVIRVDGIPVDRISWAALLCAQLTAMDAVAAHSER